MPDDVADVIAKLHEIEQQAFNAFSEAPKGSVVYSRLRQIAILAKFARAKLEGVKVAALDTTPAEGRAPRKQ